uniref:DEP domain-containing protein n=1 Tax=Strigamia maritima TaxID=126957 RepID=T1IT99_STRMM
MNECNINVGPYRATKLWNEVVRNFRSQMPRKRHRKHVRHFDDCFTSSEAVDWLHCYMQNNPNFNPDVTREQTLQLLRKFVENGLFEDIRGVKCIDPEEFKDNCDLYRFNKKSPMKLTRTPRMTLLKHNIENVCNGDVVEMKTNDLPKCHLVARQLSVIDLENTWTNIILKRLQEKMELPNLDALLDTASVNAKYIIHNATKINKNGVVICLDKSNELPYWIISAMKCLANWPNASGTGSCLPNYPGFQMDVFAVVKDYFRSLDAPLLSYDIFVNAFVRSEYLDSGKTSLQSHKSLENIVSSGKSIGTLNETSILSSEQIMNVALTPSLCFETAFTSAEPVTRIIPQQHSFLNNSTVNICPSPFYLHDPRVANSITNNSSVRRLQGKCGGYDNLAYLVPNSEERDGSPEIKPLKDDSSLSSYHTVPSRINVDVQRSSHASSSLSYRTPCGNAQPQPEGKRRWCSWPSKRQAIEQWVRSSCWPDLSESCKQLAIDTFQLLTLILPSDIRRKLHMLLRFMHLVLKNNQVKFLTRSQVLETFSRCILNSETNHDELIVARIVNFLIDNYEAIFILPKELHVQVRERLIYLSREKIEYSLGDATSVTYCEQVSKQQYENQKENHSRRALKDLLDSLLEDEKLSQKDKLKKLKKFKEAYPDIYREKMINNEKFQVKNEKESSKRSLFQRVKSLRI